MAMLMSFQRAARIPEPLYIAENYSDEWVTVYKVTLINVCNPIETKVKLLNIVTGNVVHRACLSTYSVYFLNSKEVNLILKKFNLTPKFEIS